MKLQWLFASLVCMTTSPTLPAAEVVYRLPVSPLEVVSSEQAFRPFAEQVRADVERLLAAPANIDDIATLKMLLSSRVHLAHHFRDEERAVATAAWIRSLQNDPVEKAFAGLTTFASVNARRLKPGLEPSDPAYRAAFSAEFARLLAPLPRTPEIVAMLGRQRAKIAGLDEAALLAETRDVIAPAIERRGACGLAEADQLVRVRHRLVSILPLRGEMLAVFDAAIAERSSP